MATRRESYRLAISSCTQSEVSGQGKVVCCDWKSHCLGDLFECALQRTANDRHISATIKWFDRNLHKYRNVCVGGPKLHKLLRRIANSAEQRSWSFTFPRARQMNIMVDCDSQDTEPQSISFPSSIEVAVPFAVRSSSKASIPSEIREIYSNIISSNALKYNGALKQTPLFPNEERGLICELHLRRLVQLNIPQDAFELVVCHALLYIYHIHSKLGVLGATDRLHLVVDALDLPDPNSTPFNIIKYTAAACKLILEWIPDVLIQLYWLFPGKNQPEQIRMEVQYDTAQIKSDIVSMEELHTQLNSSLLSTDLDGERVIKGEDFVSFRKELEGLLSPCKILGELYVDLSKDLKTSRTIDLWNSPKEQLECLLQSIGDKFAEIERDEDHDYLRKCGDSHLQRIIQLYETLDHDDQTTTKWMNKVNGFYSELRKVMEKTCNSVERRTNSLNNFIQAHEFIQQAKDLIEFICDYATPLSDKFRNEPTVNVTRIRVQERQLEQLIAKSRTKFALGEKLLLQNEHLFAHNESSPGSSMSSSALCRLESLPDDFSDTLSICSSTNASSSSMVAKESTSLTLTNEHKQYIQQLWQRLLNEMECCQAHLQSVRDFLADCLVFHNMLNNVYDWALHNAKWGSQLSLQSSSPLPTSDEMSKLVTLVQQQLDSFPHAELDQLPAFATRLDDEQLLKQANGMKTRCCEAQVVLQGHKMRLAGLLEETQRRLRDVSPASSTQYELPIPKTCEQQIIHMRRSSYAGTVNSSLGDVDQSYSIRYRPLNRQSGDWSTNDGGRRLHSVVSEEDVNCDVITQDMTHQVISTMSHNTLKKKLEERRNPNAPNPDTHLPPAADSLNNNINNNNNNNNTMNTSILDRASRPGSARQASNKNKKPFKKMMKRCSTADTILAHKSMCRTPVSAMLFNQTRQPSMHSLISMEEESVHSAASSISDGVLRSAAQEDNQSGAGNSDQTEDSASSRSPPPFAAPGSELVMPTLVLPEDATPNQRMQHMILCELLHTELKYVASLKFVIDCYVPEMLRDDLPQELRGQRHAIFGNIEKIYDFHVHHFLPQLKRRISNPSDCVSFEVAKCFLDHRQDFHLYALYNKNKPKSDILMSDCGSVFFSARQLILGDKMDLASYLLKPVQRMGKYALLLQQLMKSCEDADTAEKLSKAENMVSFQLRHGNDLLAMDMITQCDLNLKEQGQLLRQDEMTVFEGKGLKCTKNIRRVFLFEKLVLIAKPRRSKGSPSSHHLLADTYQYKHAITMADCGLTERIRDSSTKFELWFRKHTSSRFVFQSNSATIRESWVNDIANLLWRQAVRNREDRLAELSSMGMGRESCRDLTASEDRIEDRSVSSVLINNKGSRFRQSFTSLKDMRLGDENNKRPQSLISVSSSSCSSSTNTSNATPLSSESGIFADLGPLEESNEESHCSHIYADVQV